MGGHIACFLFNTDCFPSLIIIDIYRTSKSARKDESDNDSDVVLCEILQNGGILRGLTPRNGWNRLISAIEGWNHVTEQETKRLERAVSTETNSTAARKSLTDVMVQVYIF